MIRRLLRWLAWGAGTLLALALAIALGFTLYAVGTLAPLQDWHTERLHEEFSALRHGGIDFDAYLKREALLFDEYRATAAGWQRTDEAFLQSRFNPNNAQNLLVDGAPYNRSFRLLQPNASGHALLIHGLTDAPYSMKALAESLHARGFEVTVLRLPGHGTLPSMMVEMSERDWIAAVQIAARDVAARTPAGQPYWIGGYSTGGTLALLQTLAALEDPAVRRPDRVLLVSPAIELTPVAALAGIIDFFSIVPIPVLEKVRWQSVVAEFDPYKFNSFPVNASRQVNRATRDLQRELGRAADSGRLARMPPVIAWQSAVDSTVGADGVVNTLYGRLHGAEHRLVLFDVNRQQALASVMRPGAQALIDRLRHGPRGYTLDLVTNTDGESGRIQVLRHAPTAAGVGNEDANPSSSAAVASVQAIDTELSWPRGLVSLGHVALPFPPDDPAYGFLPGSGHNGIASIGSWLLRGENGALTIPLGSLTRLRSNPFWSLVDEDVGRMAGQPEPAR